MLLSRFVNTYVKSTLSASFSELFTQISIAEVFWGFWGLRKTHMLIYCNLLVVCVKCRICHLMLVYGPLGCAMQVAIADRFRVYRNIVQSLLIRY